MERKREEIICHDMVNDFVSKFNIDTSSVYDYNFILDLLNQCDVYTYTEDEKNVLYKIYFELMRKFKIEDTKDKEIIAIYNSIHAMSLWLHENRTNKNITTLENFIAVNPEARKQMVLAYNVYSLMEWKQQQQQQQELEDNMAMAATMGNMGGKSKRKKNNKSKKRSKIFRSARRRMKNKTKSQRRKK